MPRARQVRLQAQPTLSEKLESALVDAVARSYNLCRGHTPGHAITAMKTFHSVLAASVALFATATQGAPPVVSNITASQRSGTKLVDIYFSVTDADGDAQTIQVQVSADGGLTYTIPCVTLSGDVGSGVTVGSGKHIVWNAGADWNGQFVASTKVRVTAYDGTTPVPPPGMVYIPAGTFQMGDNLDGQTASMPVHNVYVSEFFMDRFEVSKEQWQSVVSWSVAFGYSIDYGVYKSAGHPVCDLKWYDAVKWCNARSEKEGLTPCYYIDSSQTTVYRTGETNIDNSMVKWGANGYRLPTEAEWEKAARGGMHGQRYPLGNAITGNQANYDNSGDPFDTSSNPIYTIESTPVGYYDGNQIPAGAPMSNGYGLFDVAGNVNEWCWDWYSSTFYSLSEASQDPKGPNSGGQRLLRGGGWASP